MKLLIAGSRGIEDFDISNYITKETVLIISGGANGVDSIAERYADKNKISKLILRPQYALYGKGAPLKRNETMVDISDAVLLIWDGVSKGSKYTMDYAKKHNKPITVIIVPSKTI